ncbi:hypothetical protein GCM10027568_24870 [Humibacter soli]
MTASTTERDVAPSLSRDPLRIIALAIGVITIISGAAQVVAPWFVLGIIGADVTATTNQLFATVGAFMVIVGGALTHATIVGGPQPIVLLWSVIQKVVAVVLVVVGVIAGVFGPLALGVASFDLLSAVLIAVFAVVNMRRWAARRVAPGP